MIDILSFLLVFVVTMSSFYLLIRAKCLSIRKFYLAFLYIMKSVRNSKGISSFGAMSAVLGGNLGTGNISGIAVALTSGGPGSLVWIFAAIVLSSSLKYFGCFTGVVSAIESNHGSLIGGPMYYFKKSFKSIYFSKSITTLYVIALLLCSLTIGNFAQVNSVAVSLYTVDLPPIVIGIVMAFVVVLVLVGEIKGFEKAIVSIVPLMSFLYISTCVYIIVVFKDNLYSAIMLILSTCTGAESLGGAFMGISTWHVIKTGFFRGVFAADSGLGLESILHSTVQKPKDESLEFFALNQGLISVFSSIIVAIVCMCTGLVLIVTGVWDSGLFSTAICFDAFSKSLPGEWGGYIVSLVLFFFAFTTIISWNFCAERAIESGLVVSPVFKKYWRVIFISMIPLGALFSPEFVWYFSDILIPFLLIPNVISVVMLSHSPANYTINHFSKTKS